MKRQLWEAQLQTLAEATLAHFLEERAPAFTGRYADRVAGASVLPSRREEGKLDS